MAEPLFDLAGRRVFVAGHRGMVGSAVLRRLTDAGCTLLTAPRANLDLTDQAAVRIWMDTHHPEVVVVAAARVGGIAANAARPVEFLYENLMIEANLIEAAHRVGVRRLLFLGSSCIYPKFARQPIAEEALLTGPLEPTNEAYAIAKIAGIKLVAAYRQQYGHDWISAMPTNLYGPGDNFDTETSHVLPALIRRTHQAVQAGADSLTIWGSGTPRREFLHADDCADALVHLLRHYSGAAHVNVGSGEDLPILDLARLVADVVGFRGTILTDPDRPDGTPRKLMAADRMRALGWVPKIALRAGIAQVYAWYLAHEKGLR